MNQKLYVIRFTGPEQFFVRFFNDENGHPQWTTSDTFKVGCLVSRTKAKAFCKGADTRYRIYPATINVDLKHPL